MIEPFLEYFSQTPVGAQLLVIGGGFVFVGTVAYKLYVYGGKLYMTLSNYFIHRKEKKDDEENFRKRFDSLESNVKELGDVIGRMETMIEKIDKDHQEERNLVNRFQELDKTLNSLQERSDKKDAQLIDIMQKHEKELSKVGNQVTDLGVFVNLLVTSDIEQFRSELISSYNRGVADGGQIDIYTLQNLEKGFKRYQSEGGNSWAKDVMGQIRKFKIVTLFDKQIVDEDTVQNFISGESDVHKE